MRYPVNIRTGKGMSVSGTAASASGAVLSSVEAAILDANDQPVQSAEASPNVSSWSLKNFDSQLRFGELPEGSYTYMVVLHRDLLDGAGPLRHEAGSARSGDRRGGG